MEYLKYGFGRGNSGELFEDTTENSGFMKDVFYSPVILHVIDYMNPKYMHMQVGSFIEEWTTAQEQSIRNILYQEEGIQVLDDLAFRVGYTSSSKLNIQYNLIYFIMVSLAASGKLNDQQYKNADKFFRLESMME